MRRGQRGCRLCASLACCDLYVGVIVIGLGSDQFAEIDFGYDHCLALVGLVAWPCLMSLCSIMLIAVDRLIYVVYSIYYDVWMSRTVTLLAVMATWIVTFAVAFAPLLGWRRYLLLYDEYVYHLFCKP